MFCYVNFKYSGDKFKFTNGPMLLSHDTTGFLLKLKLLLKNTKHIKRHVATFFLKSTRLFHLIYKDGKLDMVFQVQDDPIIRDLI